MRARSRVPGHPDILLVRPLLDWRREELERICAEMEVAPIADPSNDDLRFERVRVRRALAVDGLPVPEAVARSAGNLARADEALEWATEEVWKRSVRSDANGIAFDPNGIPHEIRRRLLIRILARLANEGSADQFKARELDRMLAQLGAGEAATLRGVRGTGGATWRFATAPARRTR